MDLNVIERKIHIDFVIINFKKRNLKINEEVVDWVYDLFEDTHFMFKRALIRCMQTPQVVKRVRWM